jgi:sugar-specific transcriptional regulator TrmB
MESNKELIKRIKDKFGLNVYESKVWLALISKGVASSSEIAVISDVPRSRTYDVLESLEKKGFAIAKIGKPTKYLAVEPTVVLEKLKNNAMKEAEEKMKIIDSLKDSKEYEELQSLHSTSTVHVKKEELSSVLRGRSNIYVHLKSFLNKAKNSVTICMPAQEILEKARNFRDIFAKTKDKKISSKVYVYGTDEELANINKMFNVNVKKMHVKMSFVAVDNQVLFVLGEKVNEETLGVCINSDFFTKSLNCLTDRAFK